MIKALKSHKFTAMSEKPEERNRDSRNAGKSNIEQGAEPPLDKQDPTEPVHVQGGQGKTKSASAGDGTSMA
jgi:hypothetical protein